jgi:hypothetical protein
MRETRLSRRHTVGLELFAYIDCSENGVLGVLYRVLRIYCRNAIAGLRAQKSRNVPRAPFQQARRVRRGSNETKSRAELRQPAGELGRGRTQPPAKQSNN